MSINICSCKKSNKEIDYQKIQHLGHSTSDVYRTCNLPTRFMIPKLFKGYRQKEGPLPHPCYRSTSMDYGWHSPSIHDVPVTYFPRDNTFSSNLARAGMYRNCSLNTELDKSVI